MLADFISLVAVAINALKDLKAPSASSARKLEAAASSLSFKARLLLKRSQETGNECLDVALCDEFNFNIAPIRFADAFRVIASSVAEKNFAARR